MRLRYLLIVCTLLAASCAPRKTVQTKPELPSDLKPVAAFTPVPSVINVPIEMKTWYIEKMLNEQLAPLLYECDTLTIAGIKPVKMKVWKKDSIRINLEGNELSYKVPLKIWLQFSFTIGALGVSHTEYQDVEANIALKLRSKFSVKNNWKVVTQTRSDGYEWLSEPVIKVRFISIPIKPIVDIILSTQQASFGGLVDSTVCNSLDIKKMLRPLWNRIQAPILLSSAPDSLWLRLSPTSVYMTQLAGGNKIIKGSLGIKSVAETFFGSQPETQAIDSLPEFIVPEKLDSSFVINLYTELPFSSASQMIQGFLLGKSFSTAGKEVIIQDINFYGLDGYAVVSIDFTGSFRGKVYVIGHIKYNEEEATASVEDLDFDLSTRNSLHSTAEWLLHGIILAKVKPYLRFPLRERLLEAQLMVQKMLSHKEISKNVFITGAIDSLGIGGVTITDSAIKAILLAKGTLNVVAHD